jgi:hypothetical protein
MSCVPAGAQEESEPEKIKWGLKPEDYKLPRGALELKVERIFPTEEDENKGI